MIVKLLANAGVPMIVLHIPMMVVMLLPVVLIESLVLRWLIKQPFTTVSSNTLIANIASTFPGWVIAWILMVIVEIMAGGDKYIEGMPNWDYPLATLMYYIKTAAWILPIESADGLSHAMLAATFVLLLPYFLISVAIEWGVMKWNFTRKGIELEKLWWPIVYANIASYMLLYVLAFLTF